MLPVVPYELEEIKNELKRKAIDELGLVDAEFEGSNISQLINLLAYSTMINNTNLTYGLNEMFISQAVDRKNVIKHARQMGYTHKRNLSYQYKIKLKSIKEGELTLPKYSNFSSNGNNYVYLGEDLTDTYGTYAYVKDLINEDNNQASRLYKDLAIKDVVITEEGIPLRVLDKSSTGNNRLLLQTLSGDLIPKLSETVTQDVFVQAAGAPSGTTYRNFIKVGTVDTFLKDEVTGMFKVQITLVDGQAFPLFTTVTYGTTITSDTLAQNTAYPIKQIDELTLTKGAETIEVDVSELTYIKKGGSTFVNNIQLPVNQVIGSETHGVSNGTNGGVLSNNITTFTALHTMIEVADIEIDFGDNRIRTIDVEDLIIDLAAKKVGVNEINTSKYYNATIAENGVTLGIVNVSEPIKSVKSVIAINAAGNRYTIKNFSFSGSEVSILKEDSTIDNFYDNDYAIEISYTNIEDLTKYSIKINYTYVKELEGFSAQVKYSYDEGLDGYLDSRFYFSDARGEYIFNEQNKSVSNPNGWTGFYASKFDRETNVLYFDVSRIPDTTNFHNEYVKVLDIANVFQPALPLDKVLVSPFKKTRLYLAKTTLDTNNVATYSKIPGTSFASVNLINRKDEVEIIVKEGNVKRYSDVDDDNIVLYPELTISVNEAMAEQGYFTIFAPAIEHNGMEMFVTRIMPDGSIEYDQSWVQRDYLLAENTGGNKSAEPIKTDYETTDAYEAALIIWQRQRVTESFVVQSNLEYEDYVNVHTKYAGTGTAMTPDFKIKLNVLDSKGKEGKAAGLIAPVNNENFEAKYYIESSGTTFILHAEGTDLETTDSIRDNAPKFSNTSNRAVTKADYKTICEAQPFISSAQVWGGEEIPKIFGVEDTTEKRYGHIYFSIIPYSKPYSFVQVLNTYSLDNVYETELFFPSYTQITGKESYADDKNDKKNDKNVLFSVLDNYKIITLQLNYTKAIYVDMEISINILKYKFGQTILETNEQIFQSVRAFMVKKIEQFESTFYLSSLIKNIDENLGDNYGLNADIKFSVDLYDSYANPELGTFKNATMKNLVKPDIAVLNPTYDAVNATGYNDKWVFEMPIDMPLETLFEDDFVTDAGIVQRGKMNIGVITNCNTTNFAGGRLYMELDDGTFVAHNKDGDQESAATSSSARIEISIIYETKVEINTTDGHSTFTIPTGSKFKVGSYVISKNESVIILKLNTHGKLNILNPRVHLNSDTRDPDLADDATNLLSNVFVPEVQIGSTKDGQPYMMKEIALPRSYFMNTFVKLDINPKNDNIQFTKNTFPRLKTIEFSD